MLQNIFFKSFPIVASLQRKPYVCHGARSGPPLFATMSFHNLLQIWFSDYCPEVAHTRFLPFIFAPFFHMSFDSLLQLYFSDNSPTRCCTFLPPSPPLQFSESQFRGERILFFWPNTNTNNIRVQNCARIRIQIICYSNNIRILNTINIKPLEWIFLHTVAKSTV